jgi:hypothetical protein
MPSPIEGIDVVTITTTWRIDVEGQARGGFRRPPRRMSFHGVSNDSMRTARDNLD